MRTTRLTWTAGLMSLALSALAFSALAVAASPPPRADIQVAALAPPNSVRLASPVTVGFSVRNAGPALARSVALTIGVPSGVSVESMSGGRAHCTPSACLLGTLRAKTTRQIRVTIKAPATGIWTVAARVSSPTRDPRPANNRASARAKVAGDDYVRGSGSRTFRPGAPPVLVQVDAISSAKGEGPSGTFGTQYPVGAWIQSGVTFQGEVVCLTVTGNRASVGGVVRQSNDTRYPAGTGVWLAFTDNGSPGAGHDTQMSYIGTDVDPHTCTIPVQANEFPEVALSDGDFTVHDEQP
jgi:hypothetical protein